MNFSDITALVSKMGGKDAPLLQVLLAVQDLSPQNYVSENDLKVIAQLLNISRCRVYSTASFYTEISLKPRGRHLIRLCKNAPCENAGKAAVREALIEELGVGEGETTDDGLFTLESVSCLGACYMSPAMKINKAVYGDLTPEQAVCIIQSIRKEHYSEQTA